jgi:outer membrane protein
MSRAAASEDIIYTVQTGDTLCEIAEVFEVSCASLMEANSLGADSLIYPGQILTVMSTREAPEPDNASAPTAAAAEESEIVATGVSEANAPDAEPGKTDLLLVYQMARVQDPVFAAQSYRYQAALEIVPRSKAALRPQLSASGSHTEATSDAAGATHASIALSQSLYNKSSRISVTQAGQQADQAELRFVIASADLVNRVVNVYFSVLAAEDNVGLSHRNERAIKRQLELAQERLEVGLGTRTDLFDARARFEQAVADTIEAEKLLDDSRQTLIALVGEEVGDLQPLPDTVTLGPPLPDDSEAWVAEALKNNPDLKVKSFNISLSDLEIDRQKAQRLPSVGLKLSGNYSDLYTGDDTNARMMFSVDIPFYQGGLVDSRVREAAENLNAARYDHEAANRELRLATRQTFLGIKSRLRRIDALAEAVRAGENALLAKEESFAAGLTTNIAVLDAQRDLFRAERDYLKARYDYIRQMLELEELVGNLDEEDVRRVNTLLVKTD